MGLKRLCYLGRMGGHFTNRSSSFPEPLLRYMPSVQAGVSSALISARVLRQKGGATGRKNRAGIRFSRQKWSKSRGPNTM